MPVPPHILVTNDDGVSAPGLLALARALRAIGPVTVLAPDRNWSASGHVKTMHRPLRVWPTEIGADFPALTTDGAPSDCVALAILGLVEPAVDVVVSGINPHANLGHDVTYSGTVTAAMEAAIAGLPGMAVSLDSPEGHPGPLDYSAAATVAAAADPSDPGARAAARDPAQPQCPLWSAGEPARPGRHSAGAAPLPRRARPPSGPSRTALLLDRGRCSERRSRSGTDFGALASGYVSLTPLQLDLTAHDRLAEIESWGLRLDGDGATA